MIYNRKYNNGGLISYQYGDVGGPTGAPSSGGSAKEEKEGKDVFGDALWKNIADGGLTSDTQILASYLQRVQKSTKFAFTDEDKRNQMLDLLPKVVEMKNNKKLWESAMKTAETSGGLNEIAVGNSGELYVRGENGAVSTMSVAAYKKNASKVEALTIAQLMDARERDVFLANNNDVFVVANNSIGMKQITEYAQNIISKIGTEKKSSERVYDRDTVMAMRSRIQEELQAGRMPTDDEVQGFALLDTLASSTSNYNQVKEETSTQKNQIMKAVNYIWSTMKVGARNKLGAQAALTGQEPTQLLLDLVQMSTNHTEISSVLPIDDEKATSKGKSGSGSGTSSSMNNPQMMIHGTLATGKAFEFNDPDASSKFSGVILGTSSLTTPKGEALPATTLDVILKSGWEQIVDTNNVFFGNKKVHPTQLGEIVTDGFSEMGTVYLPQDPRTGAPDNNSLQLFKEVMKEYDKIKDNPNFSGEEIQRMFGEVGFNVTVKEDKTLDVRAKGGNVKPFWVTFAYTNNASDLVKNNGDAVNGGLEILDKNEHNAITGITDRAYLRDYGKKGLEDTRPNKRFKSERTYKGIVAIPLREGATANIDAFVGKGPKKDSYSDFDVKKQAQFSSNTPFQQTNINDLTDF